MTDKPKNRKGKSNVVPFGPARREAPPIQFTAYGYLSIEDMIDKDFYRYSEEPEDPTKAEK